LFGFGGVKFPYVFYFSLNRRDGEAGWRVDVYCLMVEMGEIRAVKK
jgi:hypothetical protein